MDKLKNMKKTTKNNIITYALVIAAFVIMQSLINAGSISSLLEGLMVPLCIYIIMRAIPSRRFPSCCKSPSLPWGPDSPGGGSGCANF